MKMYQKKINIQLEKDRVTAKKALSSGNKQYGQHSLEQLNNDSRISVATD